ncbi:MAG: hypothetical protein LBD01_04555 [Puniceicoccales bacterium]|nr:hypothetical protein [Puniceicoccales bacterium]
MFEIHAVDFLVFEHAGDSEGGVGFGQLARIGDEHRPGRFAADGLLEAEKAGTVGEGGSPARLRRNHSRTVLREITAIITGFVGVLIVTRPGSHAVNLAALLPLPSPGRT